jgi:hypothetical protein
MHRGDGFLWPGALKDGIDSGFTVAGVVRVEASTSRSNRYILGSDMSSPGAAYIAVRDDNEIRVSVGTAGLGVSQIVIKQGFSSEEYFPFVWTWSGTSKTCSFSVDGGASFIDRSLDGASFSASRFSIGGACTLADVIVRAASWDCCDLIIYNTDMRCQNGKKRLSILRAYFSSRYGFQL